MILCPFRNKECAMYTTEDEQCMFQILPHTEEKPIGIKECALNLAAIAYIHEKRPDYKF